MTSEWEEHRHQKGAGVQSEVILRSLLSTSTRRSSGMASNSTCYRCHGGCRPGADICKCCYKEEAVKYQEDYDGDEIPESQDKFFLTEVEKIAGEKAEAEEDSEDTEPFPVVGSSTDLDKAFEELKEAIDKAENIEAGEDEQLPTKEQEEEAIKKQDKIPLSLKRKGIEYLDDISTDFSERECAKLAKYEKDMTAEEEETAAELDRLYQRELVKKMKFPKSLIARMGTLQNSLSVYRYINRDVCTIMFDAMRYAFEGSLIHLDMVNMNWPILYDRSNLEFYHVDCFPQRIKIPNENVKHAMISIKYCTGQQLTEFMKDSPVNFFCVGCGHILVQTWSYDLVRTRFHTGCVMKPITQMQQKTLDKTWSMDEIIKHDCFSPATKNQVVWFSFGKRKVLNL